MHIVTKTAEGTTGARRKEKVTYESNNKMS